jgi:hypothetical protein
VVCWLWFWVGGCVCCVCVVLCVCLTFFFVFLVVYQLYFSIRLFLCSNDFFFLNTVRTAGRSVNEMRIEMTH